MSIARKAAAALVALIALPLATARAAEVIIHPTCDTYVDSRTGLGYPDAPMLRLGDTYEDFEMTVARAYLKFDLSQDIPVGATVRYARLWLNCEDFDSQPGAVEAHYVEDDSWPCDISWVTAPAPDSGPVDVVYIETTGWYYWDVIPDVVHALQGDQGYTVMLRDLLEEIRETGFDWSSMETSLFNSPRPYLRVVYELCDFGDLPDPPYNTLLSNDAASHLLGSPLHLGALVDWEPDGQPDALALGDDINGVDDDDGVIFTSWLVPGRDATLEVTLSDEGYFAGWIDFDADGVWDQVRERIVFPVLLSAGTHELTFEVQPVGPHGQDDIGTYARFRVCYDRPYAPYSHMESGEVEDYFVDIKPFVDKWTQEVSDPSTGPVAVSSSYPHIPADCFECTSRGAIVEVELWCCGYHGSEPAPDSLTIYIYADSTPPGSPGDLLWSKSFVSDFYVYDHGEVGGYGLWMVPDGDVIQLDPAVANIYRLPLRMNPGEAFIQEGTPESPITYWLAVHSNTPFGWFDSAEQTGGGAVYATGPAPPTGPWTALAYPPEHEFRPGEPMDLAFSIVTAHPTGVEDAEDGVTRGFTLHQNTPNPFNPVTIVRYEVPAGGGNVRIDVFDVTGRLVRTLVDGHRAEGRHVVTWRGENDRGHHGASGIYFCRLSACEFSQTKKMLLLK